MSIEPNILLSPKNFKGTGEKDEHGEGLFGHTSV